MTESRLSDCKLKPLPPDPLRHQVSVIAPHMAFSGSSSPRFGFITQPSKRCPSLSSSVEPPLMGVSRSCVAPLRLGDEAVILRKCASRLFNFFGMLSRRIRAPRVRMCCRVETSH
jgi:hypothetical protein